VASSRLEGGAGGGGGSLSSRHHLSWSRSLCWLWMAGPFEGLSSVRYEFRVLCFLDPLSD
jgi:hypothetical protein